MANYIISFVHQSTRYYASWSTVSDSPSSYAMSREEFTAEYILEYGRAGAAELPERLARAEQFGSSALPARRRGLADTVWCNRAGPDERCLTLPGLIQQMFGQPVDPKHVMRENFPSDDDENPFEEWCRASGIEIEKE